MTAETHHIAGRMAEFLQRQIDVLEEMRVELPSCQSAFEQRIDAEAADLQKRRERALATMTEEFALLKREWDENSGLTGDQRARVKALSDRVNALVAEVQPMLAESIAMARGRMDTLQDSLGDLRRGKQAMRAYKSRDDNQGGGLDRQG